MFNPDQADTDGDLAGDACDTFKIRGGGTACSTGGGARWTAMVGLFALGLRRRASRRSLDFLTDEVTSGDATGNGGPR